VLDTLEDWGYDVQPQVGVAGYRIDLAVRHPDQPGRYVLGIECDGAMYHSSRAARDRDRLREEVLRGLGWRLYRIWGTDWYRERPQAEQRLRTAIDDAISRVRREPTEAATPAETVQQPIAQERPVETGPPSAAEPTVEPATLAATAEEPAPPNRSAGPSARVTMMTIDGDSPVSWSAPYRRARLAPMAGAIDDSAAIRNLMRMFREVLEVEAPINQDVLFRRVAEAWGISRLRERSRTILQRALKTFIRNNPDVIRVPDGRADDTITLRDRPVIPRFSTDDVSRRVNEVPVIERETAILKTIEESPGISETELKRAVARVFGWRRMGADINAALRDDLTALYERGLIEGLPNRVRITAR
jgi:very-short-patch-repair endonuclease